jgi:hypothetical protein
MTACVTVDDTAQHEDSIDAPLQSCCIAAQHAFAFAGRSAAVRQVAKTIVHTAAATATAGTRLRALRSANMNSTIFPPAR